MPCHRCHPLCPSVQAVNDALLRQMFEPFGTVTFAGIMMDSSTGEHRQANCGEANLRTGQPGRRRLLVFTAKAQRNPLCPFSVPCRHEPRLWVCAHER